MARKQQEPKYIPSAMNTPMLNYQVYYMSPSEKAQTIFLAVLAGGIAGLIFYGGQFLDENGLATTATYVWNVLIFLAVGTFAALIFLPMRKKQLKAKRKAKLTHQFRELLSALATSLSSGMNLQESLGSAYNDLKLQFSDNAYIVQEVAEMLNGLQNNVPIEDTIVSLGERSEIEDIRSFGVVFSMCYRTGGSLKDIVRRTSNIIGEKVEIAEEIETAISSNKMQFNCMMFIPIVMVLMLRMMSSSFAASFSTPVGIVGMTVGIVIFVIAYQMGQKIMDIKG